AFAEIARRLAQENGLADGTCYLQVTRGAAPRRHAFPAPGTPPTVYACTYPLSAAPERWARGVGVHLVPDERWARCDVKSTALLANVLANQAAQEAGAEEAVFVRDGLVTEGSHTNVAAVFGGRVVTHPEGPRILSGVTRAVVLRLCAELGVPVEERPVPAADLARADEVLLTSTTSEVLPVVAADGRPVGAGPRAGRRGAPHERDVGGAPRRGGGRAAGGGRRAGAGDAGAPRRLPCARRQEPLTGLLYPPQRAMGKVRETTSRSNEGKRFRSKGPTASARRSAIPSIRAPNTARQNIDGGVCSSAARELGSGWRSSSRSKWILRWNTSFRPKPPPA